MGDEVNGPPIKEATRAARSCPQRGVFKSGEKGGKNPGPETSSGSYAASRCGHGDQRAAPTAGHAHSLSWVRARK
jgi:hypothetical protein